MSEAAKPKATSGSRLPSLNQLAARINSTSSAPLAAATTTSAPRPRLPAFALRTNSSTSLSTVASTADSTAVNPPATRTVSPTPSNTSDAAATPEVVVQGGEALTTEKLEKLNLQEGTPAAPEKKNVKVGYKNIPSLDAITARLAKNRVLSVDGSSKPPEPELIEDPKTPGLFVKPKEHPLQFTWYVITLIHTNLYFILLQDHVLR